ncbi:MAG: tRNA (N6-isopentenyl adenosine(37)-C2)-methylthiotransferase MiaB [Acutalibacteraceae bacterium]|nr:tRNA (N6-isopentenyl adenosine(37)-C2)-methylthiotransferase MiaB [Acutalibacteraceae bacterium]
MNIQDLNEKENAYLPEQRAYANRVKNILAEREVRNPKAHIVTFGCQQNVSDSERIKGMLSLCGYTLTDDIEKADFILFNTCAVREHAEDRVYGNVGATKKYKQQNPNLLVSVCGCMAQQQSVADKFYKSYPYVDIVFGTQQYQRLPEFIYRRMTGKRVYELALDNKDIVEDIPVIRDGTLKGWLPIMYGCNNFCTYCIVPYVRGRERSREPNEVVAEATQMVNSGFKEIMLLGQNVNSYGKGEAHGVNFAKLLRMINDIPGDFRIRFMTSHPKDCTEELLDTIRDCKKVERHIHLPFQCGSSRILKQMNRHYDREGYLKLIASARERIPDVEFTSDIIVGFPGETYEDFCETLSLVKEVRFTSLFTFIYSPREGTPAASMPDPISREEKGKWFNELLAVQDDISKQLNRELIGKTVRVLCEEELDGGKLCGKSEYYSSVTFSASRELLGKFVTVRIENYQNNTLYGTVIN